MLIFFAIKVDIKSTYGGQTMKIQEWFLKKNYSQGERYAISLTEPIISKETQKAYFLVFRTEFGTIKGWFPKSVCKNEAF